MRLVALSVVLCLLTGCALETTATQSNSNAFQLDTLSGNIHGGQQPVTGSHIYLFAAGTTASAGSGITASSSNASISLITDATNNDAKGNYVLSDAGGNFALGGKYTCTAGQNVYALAYNGNPGVASANPYLSMIAVLGKCPAAGNFAGQIGFFTINELTTVAAAYSLAGFASDAFHISDDEAAVGNTSSTVAATGMTNAFINANQIVTQASGYAVSTTPTGGSVSNYLVNTLGNIMAYCVNTTGSTSNCTQFFLNTKNANNIVASDTATAMINLAQNPGNNVATLFGYSSAASPFQPTLSSTPNDYSLGIRYSRPTSDNQQQKIAIDSVGNVYSTANQGGVAHSGNVVKFSPQGALAFNSFGLTGTTALNQPWGLAIDPTNDNVWISDAGNSRVVTYTPTGTRVSPVAGYNPVTSGTFGPIHMAFDSNGNVWVSDNSQILAKLKSDGTVLSGTGYVGPQQYQHGIVADASGNMWVGIYDGSYIKVDKVSSAGTYTQYSSPTQFAQAALFGLSIDATGQIWAGDYGGHLTSFSSTGTWLNSTAAASDAIWFTAVDGANNNWSCARNTQVHKYNSSGTRLTPTTGLQGNNSFGACYDFAFDASGSLWVLTDDGQSTTQMLGMGAPVVTPVSLATKLNKIGQRP